MNSDAKQIDKKVGIVCGALLIGLFLCSRVYARPVQDSTKPSASSSCGERIKTASTSSWVQGFLVGDSTPLAVLSKNDGPIPIQIVTEQINGSDAYQYAAAQVIKNQFGDQFTVVPYAQLILYLGGTDTLENGGQEAQNLTIRLQMFVSPSIRAGDKTHNLEGTLVLGDKGGLMENYSLDERVQYIKQKVYAVLSGFLQHWQSPSP